MRYLIALLACALAPLPATASMYLNPNPGAWPGGHITWYYNPAGRPANINDAEILAAVNASFATWQRACGIQATYGGLTTTPANPQPSGAYVIGWADLGSPQFYALGGARSSSTSGDYRPFTGGGVRINTNGSKPQAIRAKLDGATFVGVLNHEIGHSLGLAHSDDPVSIMFANPYNTDDYFLDLQGDDVSACAELYGGKGVIPVTDHRTAAPAATAFTMTASVQATQPTATPPSSSLSQIDAASGATYYFATHWQNLPAGAKVVRQTVSPYGGVYIVSPTLQEPASGFRFNVAPDYYRLPFAGRWAFQVLVNQQLAANVAFDVLHGQVDPVAAFEAAIVGERQADGVLNWRVVPYGRGKPVQTRVIANGSALAASSAAPQAGGNTVEVWMETDRPRYKPNEGDGQPAHSFDVVRRASFAAAADGSLPAAAIQVNEWGTLTEYAANATVVLTEAADHGVYVAAMLGGTLYFRTAAGWSAQATPLLSARGPAVVMFDALRNLDVRNLPAGTALFVGYGRSLDDVVGKQQYKLVHTF